MVLLGQDLVLNEIVLLIQHQYTFVYEKVNESKKKNKFLSHSWLYEKGVCCMDQMQKNEFIKNKFEEFLKKKELTFEEYNRICEEERSIKNISNKKLLQFLSQAKTQKDLSFRLEAIEIKEVAKEVSNISFDDNFELEISEIEDIYDRIRPKDLSAKKQQKESGNYYVDYYSKDLFLMMKYGDAPSNPYQKKEFNPKRSQPFYILSQEYYDMNINDCKDELIETNQQTIFNQFNLEDLTGTYKI